MVELIAEAKPSVVGTGISRAVRSRGNTIRKSRGDRGRAKAVESSFQAEPRKHETAVFVATKTTWLADSTSV
jgi:hypothetical protein